MAIASVNAVYSGLGPTASGQILAGQAQGGSAAQDLEFTATFIGDGASTSATLNLIDGTATLSFTPSGLIVARAGKAADTAAATINAFCSSVSNSVATIQFSAAPANLATITVVGRIVK